MLSKEEIEKVKKFINNILLKHNWFDNAYLLAGNAKTLIMYIEQLESREQKLIEKLEETIDFLRTGKDIVSNAKRECLENVLKILKGEEDE